MFSNTQTWTGLNYFHFFHFKILALWIEVLENTWLLVPIRISLYAPQERAPTIRARTDHLSTTPALLPGGVLNVKRIKQWHNTCSRYKKILQWSNISFSNLKKKYVWHTKSTQQYSYFNMHDMLLELIHM